MIIMFFFFNGSIACFYGGVENHRIHCDKISGETNHPKMAEKFIFFHLHSCIQKVADINCIKSIQFITSPLERKKIQ